MCEERIRAMAHQIWLDNGRLNGHELDDWEAATNACNFMQRMEDFMASLTELDRTEAVKRLRNYFKWYMTKVPRDPHAHKVASYVEDMCDERNRLNHSDAWMIQNFCVFGDLMTFSSHGWNKCKFLCK